MASKRHSFLTVLGIRRSQLDASPPHGIGYYYLHLLSPHSLTVQWFSLSFFTCQQGPKQNQARNTSAAFYWSKQGTRPAHILMVGKQTPPPSEELQNIVAMVSNLLQ